MGKSINDNNLIAWYPFDDIDNPGKDASGNGNDAVALGEVKPYINEVDGTYGAVFSGGEGGASSYFELPCDVLKNANDMTGLSISAWINPNGKPAGWERIFDLGHDQSGPYLFLTRFLRGICYVQSDLAADAGKPAREGRWTHVVMTITPSLNGGASSAGPRLYVGGELVADGIISQTSSGNYKLFRDFMKLLEEGKLDHNYIGKSQYEVDPYFEGAISDFRIYNKTLSMEEVIDLFCERMTDEQILVTAREKFLEKPLDIITDHVDLPDTLMKGKVSVSWDIKPEGIVDHNGDLVKIGEPVSLDITATLKRNDKSLQVKFRSEAVPGDAYPYEFTLHTKEKVLDISSTLFGLFFEDINHSADGGIYAEMVQNRSFEDFTFNNYNSLSGENGLSGGREYTPLQYWFGDTDKVEVLNEGGISEYLGYGKDNNPHYIKALEDSVIINHGFCSENGECAMIFNKGEGYTFSVYAKSKDKSVIEVVLQNSKGEDISDSIAINIEGDDKWSKYTQNIRIYTNEKYFSNEENNNGFAIGQLLIRLKSGCCVDMISLMPDDVWGREEEQDSKSANTNYKGNPNYRLRPDIMKSLVDMHPSFIRFPGGCISEGSYTWENVYDWKDSVGDVAVRKENVNVWGYNMTMGLGYMEYFQMAEDLGASPLPVMACGVLCQARSDYANPAGGRLREKYISNFIDLIDFAISTDFENNKWALLRKSMGHKEPFDLHYLGVGNENWGDEFFANFELFYHRIKEHLHANYPGYPLTIVSTAGAQADDDAYKIGWQFLCGRHEGASSYRFTDGVKSWEEEIEWYKFKKDYLDTIVDEHYYRSNEYLLENVDRYNYYQRAYKEKTENGKDSFKVIDDDKSPKVFVGEYASTDKNTLKGAIAEAATMIGYERNSDVVRMASTAPLFNQIAADGSYRWTPDCIWFDKTNVYRTPTYFVQQMFMTNQGKWLLKLDESKISNGRMTTLKPHGGFTLSASKGKVKFLNINVTSNIDGRSIFSKDYCDGIILGGSRDTEYLVFEGFENLSDYTVTVKASKLDKDAVIEVGCGLMTESEEFDPGKMTLMKYCIGDEDNGAGLKVIKDGVEGYTLGDYSSSVYAGNLRACHMEEVDALEVITALVNFGGDDGHQIIASYENKGQTLGKLSYKLESYNKDIFASLSKDDEVIYLKLVNANDVAKKVHVVLDDKSLKSAKAIVLKADSGQVDIQNVNVPETILPKEYNLGIEAGNLDIKLAPWSLNVFRICR